jgi:hypothetical protein
VPAFEFGENPTPSTKPPLGYAYGTGCQKIRVRFLFFLDKDVQLFLISPENQGGLFFQSEIDLAVRNRPVPHEF